MDKYETNDAVNLALNAQPVEFETAIQQLLGSKLQDAIEARREEIAKYIYNPKDIDVPSEDVDKGETNEE